MNIKYIKLSVYECYSNLNLTFKEKQERCGFIPLVLSGKSLLEITAIQKN